MLEKLGVDGSAVEVLLDRGFHIPKEKAKMVAAAMQILSFLLLLFGTAVFLEWRLVAFEEQGCSAYCNCTTRIDGRTFLIDQQGQLTLQYPEDYDECSCDGLVDRYELCKSDLNDCELEYVELKAVKC